MKRRSTEATRVSRLLAGGALVVVAILALATATSFAATTSRLSGTVVDGDGSALPGVTVFLTSDLPIEDQQMAITDADGAFDFSLLPPGKYSVEAEQSGFEPSQAQALVALDRATQVRITMVAAEFAGWIEVTAEAHELSSSARGMLTISSQPRRDEPGSRLVF